MTIMSVQTYDLCIIGGGINGAGIAREAAGRGISTCLIEARDLASGTSSASTKLVHGGLRYLEYYEFGLVRKALQEREVLLSIAPHIIWPMEFILPHDKTMRPKWMIRAGLFLYDHLAKRERLKGSRGVKLKDTPLAAHYKSGFSYSDCWVEDSRLVVLNAVSARSMGADIHTYTRCTSLRQTRDGTWKVAMDNGNIIFAKHVINATGPWVDGFLNENGLQTPTAPRIRLVKGSHIIIPKLYNADNAFILQQPDGRIVFAIPYEHNYTLIGTTEEAFDGDIYEAKISDQEKEYLKNSISKAFDHTIEDADIIHTYSGVRGLMDDGSDDAKSVTRDYKLHRHETLTAPLLSIYGGKITTYRVLAQKAVDTLFGTTDQSGWTANAPLPGGDIVDFDAFLHAQMIRHDRHDTRLIHRYARAYGTSMDSFMGTALGIHLGDDIYEAELKYCKENEFCKTADDFLWRRSKQGLHVSEATKKTVQKWFQS